MNWRFILPILAACLSAPVAAQQEGARVLTEHAETALVAEQAGFAPGETLWFALHQQLEDGWHVYWKNPGDSGLPLTLDWTLPDGFVAGDPVYPTPERIPVGPIANYGFHGEPVFLLPVTASTAVEPGTEVAIALRATWLICEEICVPEDGTFSLSLPAAADPEPALDGAVLAARARREAPAPFDGDATFQASADALVLALPAPEGVGKDAYFFSEREGLVEPAAAQSVSVKDGMLTIAMKPGFDYRPEAIGRLTGVLASSDRRPSRGFRIEAASETAAASTAVAAGKTVQSSVGPGGVAFLFAAALFGGVLLNIMPCVFPVIFIKAASLMNSVHADRGAVRRHGLLFAAGVLASFALLGGALLALRAGGAQLGWGFHLQSPMVVALSAYVLFLVGLNLSGVFEVGESLQGAGGDLAARGGDWGAFFTGVLAVVVAAPCIGPLLTAPVGAAAFLPPAFGMGIFLLMGLGLALPYLALSFSPTLGRFLPRPGPWMAVFKQALAFPVFAAAAYFLWVLAQQAGSEGLAKALGGAVMLALAAWLFQLSKGDGRRAVAIRAGCSRRRSDGHRADRAVRTGARRRRGCWRISRQARGRSPPCLSIRR